MVSLRPETDTRHHIKGCNKPSCVRGLEYPKSNALPEELKRCPFTFTWASIGVKDGNSSGIWEDQEIMIVSRKDHKGLL